MLALSPFRMLFPLLLAVPAAAQSPIVMSPGLEQEDWSVELDVDLWAIGYFGGDPVPIVSEDFDGDGWPDLAVTDMTPWGGSTELSAHSGVSGAMIWSTTYSGGYYTQIAGHEDLDADGKGDLLLAGPAEIHLRSGADGSHFGTIPRPVSRWEFYTVELSGIGDVDGDGIGEVLVGLPGAHPSGMWRAGSAYLYSGASPGGAPLWQLDGIANGDELGSLVLGVDDLNGDGTPDALIGITGQDELRAVSGSTGATIWAYIDPNGDDVGYWAEALQDTNGDGVQEVLTIEHILDGATGQVLRTMPNSDTWFAVGDQDGDGVEDLIGGTGAWLAAGTVYDAAVHSGATLEVIYGVAVPDPEIEEAWAFPARDLDADGVHEIFGAATDGDDTLILNRIEFQPVMSASTSAVSLATGGTVQLDLDFTTEAAFQEYRVITGSSGVGYLPVSPTILLPLAYDQTVYDTYNGGYPAFVTGTSGMLNNAGRGTCRFNFPAGLPGSLLGRTYTVAALAGYPWGWWTRSSMPASFTIVP